MNNVIDCLSELAECAAMLNDNSQLIALGLGICAICATGILLVLRQVSKVMNAEKIQKMKNEAGRK